MNEKKELYIDVILPLPVDGVFTYVVPEHYVAKIKPGIRVIVQFGTKKYYTGIVLNINSEVSQQKYSIKEIEDVLDEVPVVFPVQFKFWDWIASYYMCSIGEVFKAALPSGLKIESESFVALNPDLPENVTFTEKEEFIYSALQNQGFLSVSEISRLLNVKNPIFYIKSLQEKGVAIVAEEITESYRPKTETCLKLSTAYQDEDVLNDLNSILKNAKKQLAFVIQFIEYVDFNYEKVVSKNEIKSETKVSDAVLKGLIEKNIFEIEKREISRLHNFNAELSEQKELTEAQLGAYHEIKNKYHERDVVLLKGVTASGKTEIYIKLIQEYLDAGKQILYLLPEIALTTQIISRLRTVFGGSVGVYHSKYSDAERVEVWQSLADKTKERYQVILGVRSSVFLPFSRLGLVIVDEEYENTFKQFDPAPRYNARDAAIILAKLHGAKVLLGTATPSYESYDNCLAGRFGMVALTQRYLGVSLPKVIITDVRKAYKQKQMKSHFSEVLLKYVEDALVKKEQIILFQNRRGFSPYVECDHCNWVPKCKNCDVNLTYHKSQNSLICHYCGYTRKIPAQCPDCSSQTIITKGFGTEKVEDEIAILFPDAKVTRLDLDMARSRKKYEEIISDFERGEIDILVGTQMITKGLDFDNVSLVGIMNADNMLNFPDFRAFERSFQLMSQVSGRAGRKEKPGTVIIQTTNPGHHVLKSVLNNNYEALYKTEAFERKQFGYPPFTRLIKLTVRHRDIAITGKASARLAEMLRTIGNGCKVIGPEFPLINRIQNYYIKVILLKIEKNKDLIIVKENIKNKIKILFENSEFKSVSVIRDVDPI